MFSPEVVYALDVETLNDEARGYNGLDPSRSEITEIALAVDTSVHPDGGWVFSADERDGEGGVLDALQDRLGQLEPGLIVTWNGTFFDFPFIADRTRLARRVLLPSGLRMRPAPSLRPKYEPMPGHGTHENPGGGYHVTWETSSEGLTPPHAHVDVAQAYRRYADEAGVKWSLKPVCDALGIAMYGDTHDIDRTRLHEYSAAERKAYNLSDSHGTRELALRMLGLDYAPYGAA